MDSVAKKTAFDRWADAFGLEGQRRDRLWSIMAQQALSPDDVNVYFLGAAGVLEKVADQIEAANDTLPNRIEAAARRAVGPVAEAAAKSLEARLAEQAKQTEAVVRRAMGVVEDRTDKAMSEVSGRILEVASARIASKSYADLLKSWSHVAGAVVLVALLGGGALGWAAYSMGVGNGRAQVQTAADGLASLAKREDAGTILRYAQNNDFNVQQSAYCGAGAGASSLLVVVDGAMRCGPFWYDAPPVPGQNATSSTGLWNAANAPLRGMEPVLTLGFGGLIGGLLVWLRTRKKRF